MRVDLASFRARGWHGSARILVRVFTHASSMNESRLVVLYVEAASEALMLADRSRRFSSKLQKNEDVIVMTLS